MGPVRGYKKRKKIDKKVEHNASASEQEESVDWWDEFSKRINGTTCLLFMILIALHFMPLLVLFSCHCFFISYMYIALVAHGMIALWFYMFLR